MKHFKTSQRCVLTVDFTAATLWFMLAAGAVSNAGAQSLAFAQTEFSKDTGSVVLVGTLASASEPKTLVSATATGWSSGETFGVAVVPRWSLVSGDPGWTVGLGLGADRWRSRDEFSPRQESGLSLRAQSEWQGPMPGGRYYALLQASSFRQSGFATFQYSLASLPLGVELSHYSETEYRASAVVLRLQLGGSPWFLRAGTTWTDGRTLGLVGITYNGF